MLAGDSSLGAESIEMMDTMIVSTCNVKHNRARQMSTDVRGYHATASHEGCGSRDGDARRGRAADSVHGALLLELYRALADNTAVVKLSATKRIWWRDDGLQSLMCKQHDWL